MNARTNIQFVVLEALEPRLLLSGSSAISSAWFGPAVGSSSDQGVGQATESIEWRGRSVEVFTDEWIVQLNRDVLEDAISLGDVSGLLASPDVAFEVLRGLGIKGQVLVRTPGAPVESVRAWLSDDPRVAHFEPNAAFTLNVTPNDPMYSDLWGLHNTGQTGGTADADIDAPEAWDTSTGGGDVVVGVIDSGVDYTHPDLAPNMWINPGEVAGDGLDNDGNGFVDDIHGWDFYSNDNDPQDELFHGTHVAGTIAAAGDNGQGVVGVGWQSKIMALRFLGPSGSGSTSGAVEALNYATMMRRDYGVNVVLTSNSWGGGGYSQAMYDAIAASGQEGLLFIAAAGNDGSDNDSWPSYPSNYDLDNVIAVAATDHNDQLASWSNYGATTVDLGAPGVNILSTFPTFETTQMASEGFSTDYDTISGTSMATPHVAGAAALLWGAAPDATYTEIRDAILDGVDSVAALTGKVVTGGRLNVNNIMALATMHVSSTDPAVGSVVSAAPTRVQVNFSADFDPPTLDASDFTLNGVAADTVSSVDANSVQFTFTTSPVTADGPQTMAMAAGSVRDTAGRDLEAWSGVFYYDSLPMTVTATTPGEGQTLTAPPAAITIELNEDVAAASVGVGDLTLNHGTVTAASRTSVGAVRYDVTGLPADGGVQYALLAGALSDLHGNPSGAYSGAFTVDDPTIARYEAAGLPLSIPDPGTTTASLFVPDSLPIVDLDVELDITHTWDEDLDVCLISPGGTRVELFTDVGGDGNNFTETILDDEAAATISAGSAPFTGRYRPESPLSVLDGTDAAGTWTLEISDDYGWDSGTLNRWALVLTTPIESGPRVTSHDPSGGVPGPVSSVRLKFNEAIASFTIGDVALLQGPGGAIAPLAVAAVAGSGDRQFDVTFAPQATLGQYTLVVGPGITDLDGNAMDQDLDGTVGEAVDDQYTAVFFVEDTTVVRYDATGLPIGIPEFGAVSASLVVPDSLSITDLDVELDITHTYDGDLAVYLISPGGAVVELFAFVGGWENNFTDTVLDDEALVRIASGSAPFTGRYRPQEPLSVLDGSDAAGLWTLEILDIYWSDSGTLNRWALVFETSVETGPRVVGHDPTGDVDGPISSVRLTFSEAIGSFTIADVALLEGPGGAVAPTAVVPVAGTGGTTFDVTFAPQDAEGLYTLVVGPGITDLAGAAMDQDQDGVSGEAADDQHTATFTVLPPPLPPGIPGDFNDDGDVNAADIDLLFDHLGEADFDLDGDNDADSNDVDHLVRTLLGAEYGDADLSGAVDFDDFFSLQLGWGRPDPGWAQGNFDGDDDTDFDDFQTMQVYWTEGFDVSKAQGWVSVDVAAADAAVPPALQDPDSGADPVRAHTREVDHVRFRSSASVGAADIPSVQDAGPHADPLWRHARGASRVRWSSGASARNTDLDGDLRTGLLWRHAFVAG